MKLYVALFTVLFAVLAGVGLLTLTSSDRIQTRRYEISGIFLSGGENEHQQKLHEAYREALKGRREGLMRRTFEGVGVAFSEGTTAVFHPRDGQLYIRHRTSVLDTIERKLSIQGKPFKAPGRIRLFCEDILERIGFINRDPFARSGTAPVRACYFSHSELVTTLNSRGEISYAPLSLGPSSRGGFYL